MDIVIGLLILLMLSGWVGTLLANFTGFLPATGLGSFVGGFLAIAGTYWAITHWIKRAEEWEKCPHGIRGGEKQDRCQTCIKVKERAALERQELLKEAARRNKINEVARQTIAKERDRLRASIVPSLAELRELSPQQFEDAIANMYQRLGYKVTQTPYANDKGRDAIMTKDGQKYLVECKRYRAGASSGRPDLQKFHSAILSDNAVKGFFVSTAGFTKAAIEFAASVPIELIDGQSLQRLLFDSRDHAPQSDLYSSICPECGEPVLHHLRSPRPVKCANKHTVTPTLSVDMVVGSGPNIPTCLQCGSDMRLIRGRRGTFWGCTSYPQCRNTMNANFRY